MSAHPCCLETDEVHFLKSGSHFVTHADWGRRDLYSRYRKYVCNVHGRWDTPAEDRKGMEWARGFFRDTAPHATGGVYVNFLTDDESDRVKAAYGPNYHRLTEIKKKYDPQNLFRINQNIRPDIRPAA